MSVVYMTGLPEPFTFQRMPSLSLGSILLTPPLFGLNLFHPDLSHYFTAPPSLFLAFLLLFSCLSRSTLAV